MNRRVAGARKAGRDVGRTPGMGWLGRIDGGKRDERPCGGLLCVYQGGTPQGMGSREADNRAKTADGIHPQGLISAPSRHWKSGMGTHRTDSGCMGARTESGRKNTAVLTGAVDRFAGGYQAPFFQDDGKRGGLSRGAGPGGRAGGGGCLVAGVAACSGNDFLIRYSRKPRRVWVCGVCSGCSGKFQGSRERVCLPGGGRGGGRRGNGCLVAGVAARSGNAFLIRYSRKSRHVWICGVCSGCSGKFQGSRERVCLPGGGRVDGRRENGCLVAGVAARSGNAFLIRYSRKPRRVWVCGVCSGCSGKIRESRKRKGQHFQSGGC
jgi:phage shock protein PspC (stress-responsive transcriptional regulator)